MHTIILLRACHYHYRSSVEKVAIIDIDVHHGNGTEEIVQQFPHPNKLLFVSLHIFDKDGDFCFYPGSGQKDVLEDNVINVALKPLWRRNVRRSSRSSRATRDCKCGRNQVYITLGGPCNGVRVCCSAWRTSCHARTHLHSLLSVPLWLQVRVSGYVCRCVVGGKVCV